MVGTYEISIHPVAGSIKVMHNSLIYFMSIVLSGCLTLVSVVYVTMRSAYTACHGDKVLASLAVSTPYMALKIVFYKENNIWRMLDYYCLVT